MKKKPKPEGMPVRKWMNPPASTEQVKLVLEHWASRGCSLSLSMYQQKVEPDAFWAAIRRGDPELKIAFSAVKLQWAYSALDAVLRHAEEMARSTGSPRWGAIWQRQVELLTQFIRQADETEMPFERGSKLTRRQVILRIQSLLKGQRDPEHELEDPRFIVHAVPTDVPEA